MVEKSKKSSLSHLTKNVWSTRKIKIYHNYTSGFCFYLQFSHISCCMTSYVLRKNDSRYDESLYLANNYSIDLIKFTTPHFNNPILYQCILSSNTESNVNLKLLLDLVQQLFLLSCSRKLSRKGYVFFLSNWTFCGEMTTYEK